MTKEYLSCVNSATMPAIHHLWVRRSKFYNLKLESDRPEILKIFIGLFEYIISGKAEVGLLQKIFEDG
jgi:hypothetical protein